MSSKFFAFFCCLLSLSLVSKAQHSTSPDQDVQKALAEFRLKWAPDKRTSIVELVDEKDDDGTYHIQISDPQLKSELEKDLSKWKGSFTILALPDASVGDATAGLVNLSVANLRTAPSHAAEMATQLLLGTQVDILQKNGSDYRVRTPEGYIAWVPTSSITPIADEKLKMWNRNDRVIYTAEFGKSYSAPDRQSQRVSDLVYGGILSLVSATDTFYKVAYPDGRIAYIPIEEAQLFSLWLKTRDANADNIIRSAKSMLGLPYLWGGTSVKGVDCSGFTKTSYFMNGLVIPRDASQQVLQGQTIDILDKNGDFDPQKALKNLKPADLLFFAGGKNKSKNARVTHVALYLGNGQFIHAAGSVRINSMLKGAADYDDFQARTVVAAKRFLSAKDPKIQNISASHYYNNK
ncbi:C40 family peptidase [Sphingobacterium paludis]|uniref:SH3 domain-containing protein n=1 Tax=Sphingobacterium paludis TaxID=1476465 RepID=A0A4R7DE92_9SPHI|nr:C40 family peptidase [Sphingobacterium paludis]TDS17496.1 SH3 domain-containing protein [Sphingobacterium paludis]